MRGVVFLVVLVGGSYWGLVHAAREHRASLPSAGCHPDRQVRLVCVSPGTVRYARRQGWPRVLVKGGERTGDVLVYDTGRVAVRVRRAVEGFCRGQRFRLVAARS
jgi:hypothetical protein